jgi:prophage regulatory protein
MDRHYDVQKNKGGHNMQNEQVAEVEFIRLPDVLKRIPVSRSTWWLGVKEGHFPQPVRLSQRTTAWIKQDIDAWCSSFLKTTKGGVSPFEDGEVQQ